MATLAITSTPMAALAAMVGQRVMQTQANATLVVGAQELCGILTDMPSDVTLGQATAATRIKRFCCLLADSQALATPIATKLAVTLGTEPWKVRGAPRPAPQTGWLMFELERA